MTQLSAPLRWSALCFGTAVLLHVDRLPWWCVAAVLALLAWRLGSAAGLLPAPRSWLRNAIAIVSLGAIVVSFGGFTGLEAGTALLAVMGALKLLETNRARDHWAMLAVTLFLTVAACLDRQDLWRLPLYVAQLWLTCATLAVVAGPEVRLQRGEALGLAGRTLLLALPAAVLAFVLFPRVHGQLWTLPGSGSAVTGASNELSPGAIGELSESDAPAFRVRFLGAAPRPAELYWRGAVLHRFDGYTWRRDEFARLRGDELQYVGPSYAYRLTLEPHGLNWWISLDLPTGLPRPDLRLSADLELLGERALRQPVSYELRSSPVARTTGSLSPAARRQALRLPPGRNPRSHALARELRERAASDAQFVRSALALFRDGGFVYSLTPPRLNLDSIDEFIFRTRVGFCGHYASAFAMLMRAGGVPARVVMGYQGGEWNPLGGYLIVRQSDAHAWTEVFLPEQGGWTRVDPTAVVAPDRLTRGFLGESSTGDVRMRSDARELAFLQRLRLGWDALDTWWKDRVIEFDLRTQLGLLARLGFDDPGVDALRGMLLVTALAWLAWVLWHYARARPPRPAGDELSATYRLLCARLERAGAPQRAAHEGPRSYLERVAASEPQLAATAAPLFARYAELRFGVAGPDATVTALGRDVARYRPRRQRQDARTHAHARAFDRLVATRGMRGTAEPGES